MSMSPNIPIYCYWKIWLWKSKVKVMVEVNVESHTMGPTFYRLTSLSFQVNQPSYSWDTAFSDFVMVMVEVKVENYKVGVILYQLTSIFFHVNPPSRSWDTAFSKFDLENPRPRSWVRWKLKATTCVQHYIDSHPFRSMSICHPIPEIRLFQNLTLKI